MTAAQRIAAAEMTLALSQRVSYLAQLDQADDDGFQAFVPPQRTPTP
jgi:hypothetical protein